MLSKFILPRFRKVARSNDQTRNNGWYRRKYLQGGVNKRIQTLQAASPTFSKPASFFHLPRLHVLRSPGVVLFFLFHLFLPSTFFHASWIGIDSSKSGGGSDSGDDACDRASRSHGGMRPPCYSIEGFARFSQSIPRNRSRLRLLYKKLSPLGTTIFC